MKHYTVFCGESDTPYTRQCALFWGVDADYTKQYADFSGSILPDTGAYKVKQTVSITGFILYWGDPWKGLDKDVLGANDQSTLIGCTLGGSAEKGVRGRTMKTRCVVNINPMCTGYSIRVLYSEYGTRVPVYSSFYSGFCNHGSA